MDLGLKGKVAIVTGPASPQGNGRAIALALAKEGCDIACLDVNLPGAEEAAQQVCDSGRRSIAVRVDQSDYQQVKDALTKVNQELGPVDILVNNAALTETLALIPKIDVAVWDRELKISLSGPFYFTKAVLPGMIERGWGRILNISSIAGIAGGMGQVSYASCKSGLIGLTKTTALEGARYGVTANVLFLGIIDTAALKKGVSPDMMERLIKKNALRRLGTIQEVGAMAAFLVSGQASFITGSEIIMDGGQTLFIF